MPRIRPFRPRGVQGERAVSRYCRFGPSTRVCQLILFDIALLAWLGSNAQLIATLAALPLLLVPASIRQPVVQLGIGSICRIFLAGSSAWIDAAGSCAGSLQQKLLLTPNHPSLIDAFLIPIPHRLPDEKPASA